MSRLIVIAAVLLLSSCAMQPFVILAHESDPTTSNPQRETTMDFAGVGVELSRGAIDVDVALGRKAFDCGSLKSSPCPTTPGAYASVKWFPMRGDQ